MTAFKLLWFLEHLNKTEPSIILLVTPLLLPQSACCDKGLCRSMDHSRCFFFQHFPKFLLLLISADMWQTPLWHRHLLNVVLPQIDSRAGEEALFIDPILREPIMIMCVVPSTHRCNVWFPWGGGGGVNCCERVTEGFHSGCLCWECLASHWRGESVVRGEILRSY